jgi:hypothetical protein
MKLINSIFHRYMQKKLKKYVLYDLSILFWMGWISLLKKHIFDYIDAKSQINI